MDPQHLIGQAMCTDNQGGWYADRLKDTTPLRNQLTITGEHDCPGRLWWDIHRDCPATVVLKCLGDKFSCEGHCGFLLLSEMTFQWLQYIRNERNKAFVIILFSDSAELLREGRVS
jgi:hypothetical protein